MPKKKKTPKKKKVKIGLTMGSIGRIWSNGLDQNVVFLAKALKKAGFDPHLTLVNDKHSEGLKAYEGIKLEKYGKELVDTWMKFDVMIFVSGYADPPIVEKLKAKGIKIVMVSYGNAYQMFNEAMAVSPDRMTFNFERYKLADAVWVSPHFERNIPWYESYCGDDVKVSVCPYIWDPLFFDARCETIDGDPMWSPEKNIKKIAIHEPNINYLKTCVIPLSIVGTLYRKHPEMVDDLVVLNTDKLRKNKYFIDYVKSLGLLELGAFESRRTTPWMAKTGVMGLSLFHHISNGLNYLPLELMRLGYPVVHNSEEFSSAGYFYKEIDVHDGVRALTTAIETHEENFEEELKKSKELVHKYSMTNKDNIEGYKRLVEEVLDS